MVAPYYVDNVVHQDYLLTLAHARSVGEDDTSKSSGLNVSSLGTA